MNMQDTNRATIINDKQVGYGIGVHQRHGFTGQRIRTERLGGSGHYVSGHPVENILAHVAAQITIGNHPIQPSGTINNGRTTEPFGGNDQNHIRHFHVPGDARKIIS